MSEEKNNTCKCGGGCKCTGECKCNCDCKKECEPKENNDCGCGCEK